MTGEKNLLSAMHEAMPIELSSFAPFAQPTGLVIVDEVNGFCAVGGGNLRRRRRTIRSHAWSRRRIGWPNAFVTKIADPGVSRHPRARQARAALPAHCERGTGEENLVPELTWLEGCGQATLMRKDCINGFVGGIEATHGGSCQGQSHNKVVDWVNSHRLSAILTVGICTDICVMDFVLTLLVRAAITG